MSQFIRHYYLYRFLCDLAPVYAVYVLLFKLRGLSTSEISWLLALWCLFVVLFEVPTGMLADKWNRKHMIALGLFFKAAGFLIWAFAANFAFFALGFLLWGIQETFSSGTQEALLHDNLKKHGRDSDYMKIAGRSHFFSKTGAGIALLTGGWLACVSERGVAYISSAVMLLGILPVLAFPGEDVRQTLHGQTHLRIIWNALRESAGNRAVLRLLIYAAAILGIIGTVEEFIQLYLDWLDFPLVLFGAGLVFIMVMQAFGNRVAYRFDKRKRSIHDLDMLSLIAGICLLLSAFFRSMWMIPVFACAFFIAGIVEVLIESRMQNEIVLEQRATMMSMMSLVMNLSVIPLILLLGLISKNRDLAWGFGLFGSLMILFSLGALLVFALPFRKTGAAPRIR
ncbi:MFS transporter [bacterium]|nr:MFS transporter [bacterium]